ncbi:COG4315 family predicted lipoprotein [Oryzomicrobium sp.]|uniref:COG4315 family predicted lipoprotein n=1 Tax=Oryzomicrobium sp. TaxID=1911578 RepID=UPI002FE192CA
MKSMHLYGLALVGLLSLTACATPGDTMAPARMQGRMLVGANGMTLYTLDRDPADGSKSTCIGPCATNWPPLYAEAGAKPMGAWTLVTRDDGRQQWAYKGKPLYYWSKDKAPGDAGGEGMANVWHVAR